MSIAEKILQLKQDIDDVYAADQATGGGRGDYEQGYEDGKNSVVQIDRAAKSITFISLNNFGKSEVVLNLDNVTSLGNLFQISSADNKNTTVEHLTINTINTITSMIQTLYCHSSATDQTLKHLTLNVDTSAVSSFNNTFANQRALEIIDGTPLDLSNATNVANIFSNNISLIDVRFVANSIKINISFANSPNLSTDTIQSIIDGLADLTGGTSQTLTVHKTIGKKLTDEQKAIITTKNWTLVY